MVRLIINILISRKGKDIHHRERELFLIFSTIFIKNIAIAHKAFYL